MKSGTDDANFDSDAGQDNESVASSKENEDDRDGKEVIDGVVVMLEAEQDSRWKRMKNLGNTSA